MKKIKNYLKREKEIVTLSDERLIKIDPSSEGFFDNVIGYDSDNINIQIFVKAAQEIKRVNVEPFWKTIYDPSLVMGKIVFEKGENPAKNKSFYWWYEKIETIPSVEGRNWKLGNEYQYYSFLIWLINQLVEKKGWTVTESINAVVLDSKELGHYAPDNKDDDFIGQFEMTGSHEIVGVYDLANTFKFVKRTKILFGLNYGDERSYFTVGGCCCVGGKFRPLATLYEQYEDIRDMNYYCTAWIVLE